MIWAKRFYDIGTPYTPAFDQFERDFAGSGRRETMMIKVRSQQPNGHIVIMSLPTERELAKYPGFGVMDAGQLPDTATLLVGESSAFERRFKYATL